MRTAVAVAGLLGGLCCVVAAWVDVLVWPAAALLAVAVLGAGAGLVSRSAVWLRVIVAVCFLALVASLLGLVRDSVDRQVLLVAVGVVAAACAGLALARRPARAPRGRGAHSA